MHTIATVDGVTGAKVNQPYIGNVSRDIDREYCSDWFSDDLQLRWSICCFQTERCETRVEVGRFQGKRWRLSSREFHLDRFLLMISAFLWRGRISVVHSTFDFDLVFKVEKDRAAWWSMDRFHKLDVVKDSFFMGSTSWTARRPELLGIISRRVNPYFYQVFFFVDNFSEVIQVVRQRDNTRIQPEFARQFFFPGRFYRWHLRSHSS